MCRTALLFLITLAFPHPFERKKVLLALHYLQPQQNKVRNSAEISDGLVVFLCVCEAVLLWHMLRLK